MARNFSLRDDINSKLDFCKKMVNNNLLSEFGPHAISGLEHT